jgi:hypothetical protein
MTQRRTRTRLKTQIGRFGGRSEPAIRRIELDRLVVPENSPENFEIGTLTVNNGIGVYVFAISDDLDGQFKILPKVEVSEDPAAVPVTITTLVCGATVIDFEETPTIDITITADNGVDTPLSRVFTLTVVNYTVTLSALTLGGSSIIEASTEDTFIGEVLGYDENSTLSLTGTSGSRFKLTDGNILTGAVATDYGTATSHNITIRETNSEGTNSPRDTTLAISVIDTVAPSDAELYNKTIVVTSAAVATSLGAALTDLRTYLGSMSGTTFVVSNTAITPSIQLTLADAGDAPAGSAAALSGKGLGAFRLVGTNDILHIVANDTQGLSHGIYYYLEHLGMRWLIPNEKWTVTPSVADIRYVVNGVVEPTIKVRGFAGTGGFYSANWGRNYARSAITEVTMNTWKRRMRYGAEYNLGRHIYQQFLAVPSVKTAVLANPTYLAIIDGTPQALLTSTGGIDQQAKLNAGNAAVVDLFATWIKDQMAAARLTTNKVAWKAWSTEPSDGYKWGNNTAALVTAGVGDGSATDQAWFITNAAAVKVAATFADGYVVSLAYNQHVYPPSFPLEPNVIVQLTPYGFTGGLKPETLIESWAAFGNPLAMYDYWSIPDWVWDEPVFNYLTLGSRMTYWDSQSIDGIQAETTHGAGAMGIGHYLAAHLMWDPTLDDATIIAGWYQSAFGTLAKVPMKRMMERWAESYVNLSAELSASYADITEALTLASGDAGATARILDFGRYLHYQRLRLELSNLTDFALKEAKALELAEYLLEIDDTLMVHGTRIIDLYARTHTTIKSEFLKTATLTGPRWADVALLNDASIQTLITEGAAIYTTPNFTAETFTGDITRVTPTAWSEPVGDPPWGANLYLAGPTYISAVLPVGLTRIDMRLSNRNVQVIVTRDSDGAVMYDETIDSSVTAQVLEIDNGGVALAPGAYTITLFPDGGRAQGFFYLAFYRGAPVSYTYWVSPKQAPSPRMYFYVPTGTTEVVLYYPLGDYNGVFGFQVLNPAGVAQTLQYFDNRRVIYVPVPTGQDGAVWSINRSVNPDFPIRGLTVPTAISLEADTLSVPVEALTGFVAPEVPSPIFQLDASEASTFTQEAGKVAQWADRQNPSRLVVNTNGTGSNRPVYSATAVGAEAGVTFTSSRGDRLAQQVGFGATDFPTGSSPSTIFWVWSTATTTTQKIFYYGRTASPYYGARSVGIRNGFVDVGTNGADHATSTSAVGNHLACWGLSGTSSSINVDGAATLSATLSNTPNTAAVTVGLQTGMWAASQEFFNGVVQEIRVYDSILTTDERQYIEGELATKWDLLDNLPLDHPYKGGI